MLERWYKEHKQKADFYVVYIREAHPTDGWQVQANVRQGVLVANAKTQEDRNRAASACAEGLKLSIPMLIDDMNDTVERLYAGWPDRIFIVDKDGKLAYVGAPGPAGFRPAEARAALLALLR